MPSTNETIQICTGCHQKHKVRNYASINISSSPELKERVMDGSLFTWACPHCGTVNLLSEPVLYHDPAKSLMIWLSGTQALPQNNIMQLFSTDEGLKHYTARIVDTIGDLIEKVKIFDCGLDDMVMEMTKYVTRMELCANTKDTRKAATLADAKLKFLKMDGADGDITLAYPFEGQMQMLVVGFNVYEDCQAILGRNPAITESSAGLVKIDSEWLARYFR